MKKTTLSSQKQSGTKARAILQCPDASHFVSTDVVFICYIERLNNLDSNPCFQPF